MKTKSILITAILAIMILCSIGFAKAQTIDNSALIAQLQAEIARLSAQLAQLQVQQNPTSAWCHTFTDNLKIGDTGEGVTALQTALGKEDLFSVSATGNFANLTKQAVIKFQEKYASDILTPLGLIQGTGYVGLSTRKKLNALYGCAIQPICTPNWTCGWGSCVNGYQSQVAVDSNNCGLASSSANIACTALARICATNAN